ncbi:MAG: hypothetical protein ACRDK5_10710 [Solirubrobacterales bacterium]
MNDLRGPCKSCGAPLATDQRYCIECGTRVGAPLALPYLTSAPGAEQAGGKAAFALPVPVQMATTFAAMALGFGVVIGTAISPNLAGIVASAPPSIPAPTVEEPTPSAPLGGGGGGGPAPAPTSSAVAAAPVSSGEGGGGGGGGKKNKKKKKKKKKKADVLAGVVVHVNPVAVSYSIATAGNLKAIHTDTVANLPPVGTNLTRIPVRKLRNGTYAQNGAFTAQGTAGQASFSGTVTYCADTTAPEGTCDAPTDGDAGYVYTVSTVGSSALVRVPSASASTVPKVGQLVTTTVQVSQFLPVDPPTSPPTPPECIGDTDQVFPQPPVTPTASLLQSSLSIAGTATGGSLEAVIQGRCPADSPAQMILSADDIRESSRDLAPVTVGPGIDQGKLYEGQPVMVSFALSGSGSGATFTVNGIGSDHGIAGADDQAQGQGTLTRPAGVTAAVAREARKAQRAKKAPAAEEAPGGAPQLAGPAGEAKPEPAPQVGRAP